METNEDDMPSEFSKVMFEYYEARAKIREVKELIKYMSYDLSDRERKVLFALFGIDRMAPLLLGEIGKELGLTRERIRQISERAIWRIDNARKWKWKRVKERVDCILSSSHSN